MVRSEVTWRKGARALTKFVPIVALTVLLASVGVEGIAGATVLPGSSTVVASPTHVAADGATTSTITVTLVGGGAAGDTISLQGTASNTSVINGTTSGSAGVANTAIANGSGVATFTVTDANPESVTYQATDVTAGSDTITQEPTVIFEASVAFNNNGGTGTMASETAVPGATLTPNTFTRTGYTFTGWNTLAGGTGTAYANDASYPFTANGTTLYAQWSVIAEASGFPVDQESVGLDSLTIAPQHVGDLVILSSQIHSQTITVTGVSSTSTGAWSLAKRYIDTTNGVITEEIWWAVATSTTSASVNLTYSGSVASLSPELVIDSYTSSGGSYWSFVAAAGNAATSSTAVTFPSVTSGAAAHQLYWGYVETFTTATAGSTPGFNYFGTTQGNLVASDTNLSATTAYAPTASASPAGSNTSIGAIFAAGYTVTFNANGGTGTMANQSAITPTDLTSNAFARTGYTFAGWNTVAGGGGTPYADDASYPFTANTTLYAQWTPNSGGGNTGGGGGTAPTLGTLSVTAGNLSETVGATFTPTASVGGLATGDTATLSNVTYTYAGTGSTVYAASTTAPSAAGTYSVTPSGATVAVTPSADAANYSTTISYVPGTLTIAAVTTTPPPPTVKTPHASRVVGNPIVGKSRTITIVGTGFTGGLRVTSNEVGAVVRVRGVSGTRIVITITLRPGLRAGEHTFTIRSASGKVVKINYKVVA